ncbi:arsenate reductase [Paenimyroides aquimaris]|uniref:Arsenate reductase n=1 Tax=Paenimyroides marinum TaxID=1159016 RepID=A0A1H6MLH5_9FLAO|nr:arsenate reductase (glutaredoxin) [Paenimyroides aquimaris]SEH98461.1 arsenate reductase [Paenimyroides aquimaris]
MIKIYHNPRCSKSREGLCTLQDLNQKVEIINYIENPLTFNELKRLIALLKIKPIELVRTKESIWKEQFKDKNLTDEEIIEAMVTHPKLIERPIVVNGNKAVIARPIEKIDEII